MSIASERVEKAQRDRKARERAKFLDELEHAHDNMEKGMNYEGIIIPNRVMKEICKDLADLLRGT